MRPIKNINSKRSFAQIASLKAMATPVRHRPSQGSTSRVRSWKWPPFRGRRSICAQMAAINIYQGILGVLERIHPALAVSRHRTSLRALVDQAFSGCLPARNSKEGSRAWQLLCCARRISLYANDAAVRSLHARNVSPATLDHDPGAALALVTWAQREDPLVRWKNPRQSDYGRVRDLRATEHSVVSAL